MESGNFNVIKASSHLETVWSNYDHYQKTDSWLLHAILISFLVSEYHDDKTVKVVKTYISLETRVILFGVILDRQAIAGNSITSHVWAFMINAFYPQSYNFDEIPTIFDNKENVSCFTLSPNTGKISNQDCPPLALVKNQTSDIFKFSQFRSQNLIGSSLGYNFEFFQDAVEQEQLSSLKHELESLIFTVHVFFRQLESVFKFLGPNYFCPLLHSILQFHLAHFPNVDIHAMDMARFVVYYGQNTLRHMLFEQQGKVFRPTCQSGNLNPVEPGTEIGLRINMNISSKSLSNSVNYDNNQCHLTYPQLLKAYCARSNSSHRSINLTLRHCNNNNYWKDSFAQVHSYALGQFIRQLDGSLFNPKKYEIFVSYTNVGGQ